MKKIRSLFGSVVGFLKNRWKLIIVLVLVIGGIAFWQIRKAQSSQPTLTFTKPTQGTIVKTLQVSGVIDATEKANMRFAAGGKVVSLGAQEGEYVKKGQMIATIDQRELQKRLQQDLNAYMAERWDWETSQDATDYNVETLSRRKALDKEQWDLTDTVLNVEIRDISIQNTVLRSPFTGILVSSPTSVTGVNILATDVFEVVNPQTLIFKAAVDEADINQVKIGQQAVISLDSLPDQTITTYVKAIDFKSSQSSTGSVFLVDFPIENTTLLDQIRLGMNGDITITIETKENVVSVPLDTTRQRDGKTIVDVRTGPNTAAEREITTGLESDESVEVLSGLTLQDEVVVPDAAEK